MNRQDIDGFVARLRSDGAFAGRFEQCLLAVPEKGSLVDAIIGFAAAEGYVVAPEDAGASIEALRESSSELSDDALDSLAGGVPLWFLGPGQARWEK